MTLPMSDQAVAARVLKHIELGTTDSGAEVWREPVENYRSEARLEREIAVLRRFPTPFCPSAALPEAGCYVAREAAGTPIVAVRGRDGVVRAFRNVCRHRGMRVATGSGCANAFMCGYHGWTYGLDGALKHVPHERGFPGLDKSAHGLVPVAAEERAGLVFVTQDAPLATLEELPELIGPDQTLYASNENVVEANWKIFLEGFLEGYHIRATHPEIVPALRLRQSDPDRAVRAQQPRHVSLPADQEARRHPGGEAPRRRACSHTSITSFPNALVTTLSSHTNLVILEPVTIDKTRFISYTLTNAKGDEALAAAKKDAAFVGNTGAAEDRAVVCSIQRGVSSGANDAFTFGHFENALIHFHRVLDAALA